MTETVIDFSGSSKNNDTIVYTVKPNWIDFKPFTANNTIYKRTTLFADGMRAKIG
jgi:hypothetical protein